MILTFIKIVIHIRIGIIADNGPDIYCDNLGPFTISCGNSHGGNWGYRVEKRPLIVTDARSRISRSYPRTQPAKTFQDKLGSPENVFGFSRRPVDSRAYAENAIS